MQGPPGSADAAGAAGLRAVHEKASHRFDLLDAARGVIGVTERAAYIGRVRTLARGCCEAWLASRDAA